MAYDEGLAERIREVLDGRRGVSEKKMFGGVAFMAGDKMFVGIVKEELMARIGPDNMPAALKRRHVRPMDFTGKPMAGYVYVAPAGIDAERDLRHFIDLAAAFVKTLPAKKRPAAKKPAKKR
jgi:TfoX/Sxy family transcriptional regulator of competence genes